MKEQQLYQLLANYFCDEISESDKLLVENWIKENTSEFLELKNIWENSKGEKSEFNTIGAWKNISLQIENRDNYNWFSKNSYNLLKYAASIIIIVFASYYYFNTTNDLDNSLKNETNFVEYTSSKGEISNFVLDDGSKVTLNAGSKIEYLKNKIPDTRYLKLFGEAYFEVAANKNKPFIVETKNTIVQVIGTKFNITSLPNNNRVIVGVSEGEVIFKEKNENKSKNIKLTKNNSALFESGVFSKTENVDVNKIHLSWMENKLYFFNSTFDEVIYRIENKYNKKIIVNSDLLLEKHLTAEFSNEKLDDILKIISIALNINYRINGESIIFSKN